jgi:uncharacterized membrane protein
MEEQDKKNEKGLALMFFIFGCVSFVFFISGDTLIRILSSLASIAFFITSLLYWKKYKKM